MDISLLPTTNDIEQLRAMALAMVQNTLSENAEKEKLHQRNTDLRQRILLLEEALLLARPAVFFCHRLVGVIVIGDQIPAGPF